MIRMRTVKILICIVMMILVTSCGNSEQIVVQEEQTVTKPILLEQPKVIAENTEQGVLVKWNEIPLAEGYYVYSRTEEEGFERIATLNDSSVTEYMDSKALVKTKYYYTVVAYSGEDRSEYESVSIDTAIWKPEIEIFYRNPIIEITWKEVAGCDGYIIYRKLAGENYGVIAKIENASITSYKDSNVDLGEVYAYAVKAYVGEEKSESAELLGGTLEEPMVQAHIIENGIELQWDEVESAEGYIVYRRKDGEQYEVVQELIDSQSTVYLDIAEELMLGEKYTYAVRAYLREYKSSFTPVEIVME